MTAHIITVYNRPGIDNELLEVNHKIEELVKGIYKLEKKTTIIIGGDFNFNLTQVIETENPKKCLMHFGI